ncbi:MAG TPA: BTAD domain-containing putative transcriptional regulator [Gemmatimonadales bacterium]
MFRLRVLGGFALEGPSEGSTFPVPQPRAEAVLAVLAVCGDLGCTRERLMALLWPESDAARARRALRDTLHTIRHALGASAVLSAGELLRLDTAVVGSDVQSFAQGLGSDRRADAVRSYGGPLLEGFHLDGAPDFERWLDGERARLARECLEALEQLAQRSEEEGAWAEASGWWARAVEQDPLNSHFVLQHARALSALGDRANAIKAAEVHTRRLRTELDMEPDSDVLERIEGIRRGEVTTPHNGGTRRLGDPPERLRRVEEPAAGTLPPEPPSPGSARPRRRAVVASALGAGGLLVAIGLLAGLLVKAKPSAIPLDATAIAVLPFQVVGGDSATRILARSMGVLFELKVRAEFGRHIRYPGSVEQHWHEAGGTLDSAISEEAELSVARAVGAGRLVRGTIVTLPGSLALSASMLDVATGTVRVMPVRVEGTIDQQQELVDRLVILLLSRDAGYSPASAPQLVRYKSEAIQAYLAADRAPAFSQEQKGFYRAALAADSNLVVAAVELYAFGEDPRDTVELRYAWEHQAQLPERQRAFLRVLAAGRYGGISTEAQKIEAYEALARRWPEWTGPWGDVADQLVDYGALASVADWRQRAREALERIGRRQAWQLVHLTELAFMDEDTARARAATDSLTAAAATRRGSGWPARVAPAFRWRLAILEGDSAAAGRLLAQVPETLAVLSFAVADGRGLAAADRVAARVHQSDDGYAAWWAWTRGREHAWRDAVRRLVSHPGRGSEVNQAAEPVYYDLLLDPTDDHVGLEAVRKLERIADGTLISHPGPDDRALARCWIALWRLRHGDTTGARQTLRYLERDASRRQRFVGWERLIDVLLAEAEGGDVRAALLRMDSVVRDLPLPTGWREWFPWPVEVQNLLLARMLRRYGEPERALAAVRRRPYRADWVAGFKSLPEYLREEGRLAAQVGDTAGAIRAYRHYLALRESPDPLWRAPWDSVRAELDALVAR